jgi:hypothetical protein
MGYGSGLIALKRKTSVLADSRLAAQVLRFFSLSPLFRQDAMPFFNVLRRLQQKAEGMLAGKSKL